LKKNNVGFYRLKAQPSTHLTAWRILEDKVASKANLVSMGHREPKSHFLSFRMSRVTKSVNKVWERGCEDSSGRGNCGKTRT